MSLLKLIVDRDKPLKEKCGLVSVPNLEAYPGDGDFSAGDSEEPTAGAGTDRIERRPVGGIVWAKPVLVKGRPKIRTPPGSVVL